MEDSMKTGKIWARAQTSTEYLFDTYNHFDAAVHVLNGGWKTDKEPARWWMNYRTSPFRIAIIDSFWKMK